MININSNQKPNCRTVIVLLFERARTRDILLKATIRYEPDIYRMNSLQTRLAFPDVHERGGSEMSLKVTLDSKQLT